MKILDKFLSGSTGAVDKTLVPVKRPAVPMTPALISRKYEEEQYLKYGLHKTKSYEVK